MMAKITQKEERPVLSPKMAYNREVYRQGRNEIKERGYDAGNYGRINRRWRTQNRSAEFEDRYEITDIKFYKVSRPFSSIPNDL